MTPEDSVVDAKPAADATISSVASPSSPPPTNRPQDDPDAATYSADDLLALIRAIKFAHPEMSQRNVHAEITTVVADSDPSYRFLKCVELDEVKKVWKKALKGSDTKRDESTSNASAPPVLPPDNDAILKFYTVGDASVRTLAENYAHRFARAAAEASCPNDREATTASKYTHFFLDVPADRSGSRPHQALINYSDSKIGKIQKKHSRHKLQGKKHRAASNQPCVGRDGRHQVFKVQMAACPPGMEDASLPMLLYNEDRSAKTFLHPPETNEEGIVPKNQDDNDDDDNDDDDDDGGYFKIQEMVRTNGTWGALGKSGGQKAYFWGIVREVEGNDKRRVVSLDLEELAPNQVW